jgi:hypothetical protein
MGTMYYLYRTSFGPNPELILYSKRAKKELHSSVVGFWNNDKLIVSGTEGQPSHSVNLVLLITPSQRTREL